MTYTTTDPNDPRLNKPKENGQNEAYLVLSDEERGKGFVRPLRHSYKHVGIRPQHELRDLTAEERNRYDKFGYVKFEAYPGNGSIAGRFWTMADLASGCGAETRMSQDIAETYARNPHFYGATFCIRCQRHIALAEFVWLPDGSPMDPNRTA